MNKYIILSLSIVDGRIWIRLSILHEIKHLQPELIIECNERQRISA